MVQICSITRVLGHYQLLVSPRTWSLAITRPPVGSSEERAAEKDKIIIAEMFGNSGRKKNRPYLEVMSVWFFSCLP
jgi:hypothetical protein